MDTTESVSHAHPFPILTTYFPEMPHMIIPTTLFVFYAPMVRVLKVEIFSHQYCTDRQDSEQHNYQLLP
jgi:hypothetical protein